MKKIIIEVGSTCTKFDEYDGENIKHIQTLTIEFKRNYLKENKIKIEDYRRLVDSVNEVKSGADFVYVGGTSIFRTLPDDEKKEFLDNFKKETGLEFNIISQEEENRLTVLGVTKDVNKELLIFVGGGGSIELAVYDGEKVIEYANSNFGAMDILNKYPDLCENYATTSLDEVKNTIGEKINLPKNKAKIMVLAGGGHEKFARESGIRYVKNDLYNAEKQPIMMDINSRREDTFKYYKEISLDNIRELEVKKNKDPNWWHATRCMSAFVLEIAEKMGVEYIVPTDITMVYGIINDKFKSK